MYIYVIILYIIYILYIYMYVYSYISMHIYIYIFLYMKNPRIYNTNFFLLTKNCPHLWTFTHCLMNSSREWWLNHQFLVEQCCIQTVSSLSIIGWLIVKTILHNMKSTWVPPDTLLLTYILSDAAPAHCFPLLGCANEWVKGTTGMHQLTLHCTSSIYLL